MVHRSRSVLRGVGVVALFVLFGTAAEAQSLTSGTLRGQVVDSLGAPVAGAVVRVSGAAGGSSRSVRSGSGGRFELALLPPGEYDLLAEQLGFRPTRVVGIPVRPGGTLEVVATLAAAAPPVDRVETVRFGGAAAGGAGAGRWFTAREIAGLPERRRELTDLARLSSVSSAELEVEGLPAALSGVVVDGVPAGVARHPAGFGSPLRSAMLPQSSLAAAELVTAGADVEWSHYGGAFLSAHTRRGGRDHEVRAFGRWSGMQGATDTLGAAAAGANALEGGVLLSGPLLRDTASYVVGVEHWRFASAFPQPLGTAFAEAAAVARDTLGVALRGAEPRTGADVIAAFGRLDWQLAADHALSVRANLAAMPEGTVPAFGAARPAGFGTGFEGRDGSASTSLSSRLTDRLHQELRVGFGTSRGEYRPAPAAPAEGETATDFASTRIVAGGLALGADPALAGRFGRTAVHAQNALHWQTGAHRLKVGAGADFLSFDDSYAPGRGGEFVFADAAALARGEGVFTQTRGPARAAEFSVTRFGAFAQDSWSPVPGLELLLGVRFDVERLPTGEVRLNEAWLERTGIRTTDFDAARGALSPRLGFAWSSGERWVVRGAAGVYRGGVDPAILGELLSDDGTLEVRRGIGTLGRWPTLPTDLAAPVQGNSLTLLAPAFQAPRTARGSLGVSHRLGAATTVQVGGSYRRTEFLPRRADLNLRSEPLATDQHGRPVFGRLRQQGGVVVAEPGTSRRFPDFDVVTAINADGWSEYLGATVSLERRVADGLSFFGSYTFSQTEDNWLSPRGGSAAAGFAPFADRVGGSDWTEGVSDLDVPHRAVAGAEARLPLPGGLRLAALYRYESGAPFTPGYRDGVDANGDGWASNDPAYIDPSVPGMDALLGARPCLASQSGRFAARNSCRGDAVHSLDARLSVQLFRIRGQPAELVVDGLNLVASEIGIPDRAVHLVDANAELVWDEAAGRVTVPLVANPAFGTPLLSYTPARTLRIGFRVNY
jgi:hypothetical protein